MKRLIGVLLIATVVPACSMGPRNPVMANWKGRVVPMAYDNRTNEWNVLLGKDARDGFWQDFWEQAQSGERGNTVAARALSAQTNGLYGGVSFTGQPWERTPSGDVIHFVHVNYASGRDLYINGRNAIKTDFAWIPASVILNQSTQTPPGKSENINRGVLAMLRAYLPGAIQRLSSLSSPSTAAAAAAPSAAGASSAGSSSTSSSASAIATSIPPAGTSWLTVPGAILFYDSGKSYYEFTNFYRSPITISGVVWPTTEHYFQAQKFAGNTSLQDQIRNAASPRDAFTIARTHSSSVRSDWHTTGKFNAMLHALRVKFSNDPLKSLLVGTGQRILVENAGANDADWGAGADGKGHNWLGQMLMHVRTELISGVQSPFVAQR